MNQRAQLELHDRETVGEDEKMSLFQTIEVVLKLEVPKSMFSIL